MPEEEIKLDPKQEALLLHCNKLVGDLTNNFGMANIRYADAKELLETALKLGVLMGGEETLKITKELFHVIPKEL